jgi:hypothetical protein
MQEVLPWMDVAPPVPEEAESIHSESSIKPPGSPASTGVFSGKFRRPSEDKKTKISQESVQDHVPLVDILKKIAQQRGWSQTELNQDLQTLQKQRLKTVEDAKLLHPLSWNELGLLPIVRDLLKRELKL